MAEDSGAFKTKQRDSAQIGHFVMGREAAAKMPQRPKNRHSVPSDAVRHRFYNKQIRDVEIISNRPDSRRRSRALSVVTAFPLASTALQPPGTVGNSRS